jgi:hypothetical protein
MGNRPIPIDEREFLNAMDMVLQEHGFSIDRAIRALSRFKGQSVRDMRCRLFADYLAEKQAGQKGAAHG